MLALCAYLLTCSPVSRQASAYNVMHAEGSQAICAAGDFWHVRGSLPVGPLNSVLHVFREWRQPTLMLVGNHDQVCYMFYTCPRYILIFGTSIHVMILVRMLWRPISEEDQARLVHIACFHAASLCIASSCDL